MPVKPARGTNRNSDQEQSLAQPVAGRIPPQNIDAEVSMLGALLLDSDAIIKVVDMISPEDFYRPDYGTIYEAMVVLFEKRIPLDIITVADELKRVKKLEQVGGPAALSSLVSAVATASNVQYYGGIVREKAMLRRLINAAHRIGESGFQEELGSDIIVDNAERTLFEVTQRFLKQNFVPVRNILTESFERLDALSKQDGKMRGLSTGFRHLDNILGGLQQSDLIILAARPSMGKCVAADTEVLDPATGELHTVEALVQKGKGTIATLGNDWQLIAAQPSQFINDGIKPVYKVRTALGREIETTLSHPYLTINGWRHLFELKVGDGVAVPRVLPYFGSEKYAPHLVKLLAYFIADGGTTDTCPTFTNTNPVIIADFSQSVEQIEGTHIRMENSRGKRATSWVVSVDGVAYRTARSVWAQNFKDFCQNYPVAQASLSLAGVKPGVIFSWGEGKYLPSPNTISIFSNLLPGFPQPVVRRGKNPITELLKEHGLWNKTAHQKNIPRLIFSLEKPAVALFLNRLFACDGTAYVSTAENYQQGCIVYCSVSRTLIKQVQHLLLRFGILSKIREKKVKYKDSHRIAYELEIHGREDILNFACEIGIWGKEAALEKVINLVRQKKQGWTKDTIPLEIWQRIATKKGARSWASLGINHPFQRSPRRNTLAKIANSLEDQELKDLANSEVYWDKIVAIELVGEKQVYDLTVPGTHNFVANDFLVHNTAFALNIAENVAIHQKKTVGLFSLEMSKEQLVDRLISSIGLIDSWKLRNGKLTDDDFRNLNEAYGVLAETNLFIDDAASASIMEVRAKARRLQAEHGLDLILIDYLQLMEGSASKANENRTQEVSEISRSLKALAKEIKCPVIALSQLSRAVESRPDKRPMLSDLRESGSIEQDADVVMFLYREDYYNKEEQNNLMEVLVRKHRNGPTGDAKVLARLQFSRFENIDTQHIQQ